MNTRFSKILLTGVNGQLGYALLNHLPSLGKVVALRREQLDLTDESAIRATVQAIKPDLIVNTAAYTAVDQAETEPELAHAINGNAPGILAQEANKLGAWLVHYSTDYVFDGCKSTAYTENDRANPLNQYGESKLAGERAIQKCSESYFIFRTSWVYGNHGVNFYKTILKLALQKTHLRIVADQVGAPTHSQAIAQASTTILRQFNPNQHGLYHLSNSGQTSWHAFAEAIIQQYCLLQPTRNWPALALEADGLTAVSAAEYLTRARRPANSLLNNERLAKQFGLTLAYWQDELHGVIDKLAIETLALHPQES